MRCGRLDRFPNPEDGVPVNAPHSRAHGGAYPRSLPGADVGVSDPGESKLGLNSPGCDDRRETARTADNIEHGNEAGGRQSLFADYHARCSLPSSAPSAGPPPPGHAAVPGARCGHSRETARTPYTALDCSDLPGNPLTDSTVNIRCRLPSGPMPCLHSAILAALSAEMWVRP